MKSRPGKTNEWSRAVDAVRADLLEHLGGGGEVAVIQAPPGSGKTHLLLQAVSWAVAKKMRVAVATQTKSQADDICKRLARDYPKTRCIRFIGKSSASGGLPEAVEVTADSSELPGRSCVVVGTAAKWGLVGLESSFDLLFVEEAWQLKWADFMLLDQVSSRFVLIGDPGQIPPVVTVEVNRWETSFRPPHRPAPEVILGDPNIPAFRRDLPATRRLPHDTTKLVERFYDFPFGSWAGPGERAVVAGGKSRSAIDKAIDLLGASTAVGYTLPTPAGGPPLERDEELAAATIEIVYRLLTRGASCRIDGACADLTPDDIGICATHHAMNAALELHLPKKLRAHVQIDTAERWQGLERKMMIVVHPLSGVTEPSGFDLETGRLCVMASRHRAGLIVVSRDHLQGTLEAYLPSAEQAPGRPDAVGRGHLRNLEFWNGLLEGNRVVAG